MAIGNSVNDEIREQRKKVLEEQGFKGRLSYFFYYYKTHTIIAVLAIIAIILTISSYVNRKEIILRVVYVNAFPNVEITEIANEFSQTLPDFDVKKQEVQLDDSFYIASENRTEYDDTNEQKLVLMAAAGEIDGCLTDKHYLEVFEENEYLLDLSTILKDEEMKLYKEKLIYDDTGIPIAINVSDAPNIIETNSYPNSDCYYCIFVTSKNTDNPLSFLDFIETP